MSGKSRKPDAEQVKKNKIFYDNLCELCKDHGLSIRKMAEGAEISPSTAGSWKRGQSPTATSLQKIAKYFNITVNELLGYKDDGIASYELTPISNENMKIIRALQKASENDRNIVMLMLEKYFDEEN